MSRQIGRKSVTLAELVAQLGGELVGNGSITVDQVAPLETAQPNHISFFSQSKYREQLKRTAAGAVILGKRSRNETSLPRIVCDDPYLYFARVSNYLNPPQWQSSGVDGNAVLHPTARVAKNASVGPFTYVGENAVIGARTVIEAGCYIGDQVKIGENCHVYPRVVIYHGCVLNNRVILHSGSVIGADGFGLAMDGGKWLKIPQIGRVIVGDDVEVGANTTIDRGAMGDTILEEGVKLDNQIQVGHNVHIGAHTAIAGCVGIAGSAKIGRYCKIAGAAMILGHLEIADHVDISVGTLITKSIREPGVYSSAFPFDTHQAWLRNAAHLRHLDQLASTVRDLQKRIKEIEDNYRE